MDGCGVGASSILELQLKVETDTLGTLVIARDEARHSTWACPVSVRV